MLFFGRNFSLWYLGWFKEWAIMKNWVTFESSNVLHLIGRATGFLVAFHTKTMEWSSSSGFTFFLSFKGFSLWKHFFYILLLLLATGGNLISSRLFFTFPKYNLFTNKDFCLSRDLEVSSFRLSDPSLLSCSLSSAQCSVHCWAARPDWRSSSCSCQSASAQSQFFVWEKNITDGAVGVTTTHIQKV